MVKKFLLLLKKQELRLFFLFCILLSCNNLWSLELGLKITPSVTIPLDDSQTMGKGLAYSGLLNTDVNLFGLFSFGPEFAVTYVPRTNTQNMKNLVDIAGGLSAGIYYSPVSRLMLNFNVSGGVTYNTVKYEWDQNLNNSDYSEGKESKNEGFPSFYYRAFADASFRVSPDFTLGLGAGYVNNFVSGKSIFSGIQAGLTAKFIIETKKRPDKIEIDMLQEDSLYSLFSFAYKTNPFGYVYVTNRNNADIRNVRVSFHAERFTSSEYECGTVDVVKKNKSVEIPLLADFSNELTTFSENGQFPAEIIVEYTLLGKKFRETKNVVVNVYKRNAFTWTDPAAIATLVSPNDSSVLEISKQVIGIIRDNTHTGISQNLEFSMGLFEALNSAGIIYEKDSESLTPYAETHLDIEKNDSIQFPYETIRFRSGESDDLAVLYSAMLNSVGIKSMLILMEEDVLVGVNLGISGKVAKKQFSTLDRLIEYDDVIYLPLSMNSLKKGYVEAWDTALGKIAEAEDYEIVVLDDAWQLYTPIGVTEKAVVPVIDEGDLSERVSAQYKIYVKNELVPLGKELVKQYKDNPSDEKSNAVGMAYLRIGNYKNAKQWFQKGADNNNLSSLSNLGNICLLEKELDAAEKYFEKVLQIQPDHAGALQGIERVKNQREN
ncbi:MAG: tetratricopeptide repeat protein [Treponema sp.]|nr:tetratricopeptide repeat protein [Treponema sp.]